jgi:hypothetical protein
VAQVTDFVNPLKPGGQRAAAESEVSQDYIPIEEVMRRAGCKRRKAEKLVAGQDRIDGPRMKNGKPKPLYSAACLDGVAGAMKVALVKPLRRPDLPVELL